MTTRKLIVMRHAKAEPFAASDHDRALTARGIDDAAAAGRWLVAGGTLPDYVVVSSAARTQGTWAAFAAGSGLTASAVIDRALYAADTDSALEIIRTVPKDARTVMVLGHNPTMEMLVHLLDDGHAESDVFAAVSSGYPTSALTVMDVWDSWPSIDVGTARIKSFHVGRSE